MSFCQDVKRELCRLEPKKDCCRLAEVYAPLLCSRQFLQSGQVFATENKAVAARFAELMAGRTGTIVSLRTDYRRRKSRELLCAVCVDEPSVREQLAERLNLSSPELSAPMIDPLIVEQDCCVASFFRGLFLAYGQMTNPEKEYHLELSLPAGWASEPVLLLGRQAGLSLRLGKRKKISVLYLKEREQIEDFLTFIGATHATLQMMEIQILKEMRGRVTRQTNCETANLDKTVSASSVQIQDIRYIEEHGGLQALPEDLREIARLRLHNADLSLRELSELMNPPLSRSGVNHRLRRISEFAEDLRRREENKE